MEQENALSKRIIGAAIEVHRELGPGLLESAYEDCLAHELTLQHIPFQRQVILPIVYKGTEVRSAFRLDLFVDGLVIVELKAAKKLAPIHEAQLLTYLKLTKCRLGLLLNFNVPKLRQGIKRLIL